MNKISKNAAQLFKRVRGNLLGAYQMLQEREQEVIAGLLDDEHAAKELDGLASDAYELLESMLPDTTTGEGQRAFIRAAEAEAKKHPGKAGRADAMTSISEDEKTALAFLMEGPKSGARIQWRTKDKVDLRRLERELNLIDYDGEEWNLTERGMEACKTLGLNR